MKKKLFTFVALLVIGIASHAQEKMKVELKNGTVATYNVADINRFYFVTEEEPEQLAENCGIKIKDELSLVNDFAFEVEYEPEVEYVLCAVYMPNTNVDELSDADIIKDLTEKGTRLDKSTTVITGTNMQEGADLTFVYAGYNVQGKHGPIYRHRFTTHKQDEELMANVTTCKYNNENFFYTIEIDDNKVLKYYLLEELGFDLELINTAALGLMWRKAIPEDPEKGEYYSGKSFTTKRPNGETHIQIATWAIDFNEKYSGNIFEGVYHTTSATRSEANEANAGIREKEQKTQTISAYNKSYIFNLIKNIKYKIIYVK